MAPPDIHKLARLVLAPGTMKEYDRDLAKFLKWLERKGLDKFDRLEKLDELVTRYCIYTYEKHRKTRKQRCVNVKNALEFYFPELSGTFTLTNKSLKGWTRQKPTKQHTPAPYKVMLGIAYEFLRIGQIEMMVATLLTFDCYLRASDIHNASKADLTIFPNLRQGICGVLRLPKTKRGINQSVKIRGLLLHTWLQRLVEEEPDSPRLFNFSLQYWRKCMARTRRELGLQDLVITPHSLRYGGATHDALLNKTHVQDIQQRGRWANLKSLRRYLQEGEVALLNTNLSAKTAGLLEEINADVAYYFNLPTRKWKVAEEQGRRKKNILEAKPRNKV